MKKTKTTKQIIIESVSKQKLMNAFCNMDIRAFEELIGDEIKWHDGNKYDLLAHLKKQFQNFRDEGDTHLIPTSGRCVGCKENLCGYRFEGNRTHDRVSYVIEDLGEGKFDLSQCRMFHVNGELKPELPF